MYFNSYVNLASFFVILDNLRAKLRALEFKPFNFRFNYLDLVESDCLL